jgi:translation initiation factor 1
MCHIIASYINNCTRKNGKREVETKMREKKSKIPLGGFTAQESQRALAEQLKAKGFTESARVGDDKDNSSLTSPTAAIDLANAGKIVLRHERKGRSGKTVTLITGLSLPVVQIELLARALRKGLGCGATIEQRTIVLQGDIVERAQVWLEKHGGITH